MRTFFESTYSAHKELVHDYMWRVSQIFFRQGLPFIILILCAKLLPAFDFGIYNYVLTAIFFLALFGDFGISTATSRYVAEYNVTDKEKLKSLIFNSALIIFVITILLTLLTLAFGKLYFQDKYVYVLYVLPLVFLAPMTSLYDGVYRGLRKFKLLSLISIFVGIASLPLIYISVAQFGLKGALFSQSVFYLLLLVGLFIGSEESSFKLNRTVLKEVGTYGFIYGIAVFGNYLFIRAGILILGHYDYILQIATYELLNKIFTIFLLPFILLGQVVAPHFTELHVLNRYDVIYSKLKEYSLNLFIAGIVLGSFFYLVLPTLIRIFLPNYYNSILFAMLPYVTIIYALNVWAATIDFGIVVPIGYANLMAKFYIVLGVFGSILSLVLVHLYSYMGVIYSFTLCSLLMVVGLRALFFQRLIKKQQGLNPPTEAVK
jgi:O-antigen/teichoic acid export membrane protein